MNAPEDRSREANELRKSKRYKDALEIYRELWDGQHYNEYTAAGLLHCLRKLQHLDEAMTFADEIAARYPDHNWVNLEVAWTYASYIKGWQKSVFLSRCSTPAERRHSPEICLHRP